MVFYNYDLCKIQKPKATIIAPSAEAGDDAWKECFRFADLKILLKFRLVNFYLIFFG